MRLDERKAMWLYWSLKEIELARKRHAQQGYIYQELGHWYVRFYRDVLIEGKVERKRDRVYLRPAKKTDGRKPTDLVTKVRSLLTEIDSPDARPTAMMTFGKYYLGPYQSRLRATSRNNQVHAEAVFRLYILPALGERQLREITREQIQNLINAKKDAGLSWATLQDIRKFIAAIFNHARTDKVITGDLPTEKLKMPPRQKRNPISSLDFERARYVLTRIEQPYLSMVALSMCCSPNVAELLGLKWKRLNLTDDVVMLDGRAIPPRAAWIAEDWTDAALPGSNEPRGSYGPTKTQYRDRLIPLPDAVIALLLEWRIVTRFREPDDCVFASSSGRPVNDNNANKRIFKPIGKAIGLDFSWGSFRHTFASRAEDVGVKEIDKKALMGHSLVADITLLYTDEVWERMRLIVNALAERFGIDSLVQARKGNATCPKVVSIR